MRKFNNRTTGPTDFPPSVSYAISQPIISHRSEGFKKALERARFEMQNILSTQNIPMFFTASGTGGLEAAVLNTITKESKVLSLSCGYYGSLWSSLTQRHLTCPLREVKFTPGTPIHKEKVQNILKNNIFDVILLTHTESSTGILNPLSDLTKTIKEHSDALILVDAISSVGTTECFMDDWNIDVIVTASQKALMAPPGVAIVCANDRAIKISQKGNVIGSFYFDFSRALEAGAKNQTPATPNVLGIVGIDAALALMKQEGIQQTIHRHKRLSSLCQQGIISAGIELFAQEEARAPGITAICLPEYLSAQQAKMELEQEYGLLVTTGLDYWTDQVIRIGHMGWVFENHIHDAVSAVSNWMGSRK